jgi:hypothetical protein
MELKSAVKDCIHVQCRFPANVNLHRVGGASDNEGGRRNADHGLAINRATAEHWILEKRQCHGDGGSGVGTSDKNHIETADSRNGGSQLGQKEIFVVINEISLLRLAIR